MTLQEVPLQLYQKKAPGRSWKYSNISRTFQNSSTTLENWKSNEYICQHFQSSPNGQSKDKFL